MKADVQKDIHSGDNHEDLVSHLYYLEGLENSDLAKKLAMSCNVEYAWPCHGKSGAYYNAAMYSGTATVLMERSGMSVWNDEFVGQDKEDIRNFLKTAGILEGEAKVYDLPLITGGSLKAPATGVWRPALEIRDQFRKGDKLGEVQDYFGETIATVTAPEDGFMLYQVKHLQVIKGHEMLTYGVLLG